jgi:hypothetical protein
MKEMPVSWAVLKIGVLQLHPLRGSPSMANNITTSQRILLWAYREFRLWNKQVQGLGAHCVTIRVFRLLLQYHR